MTIYIDADGCPVVDITIKIANMYNIDCVIYCDTSHFFDRDGAETVTVSKGADSVDFAIVNRVHPGDIVVTQDYGLAAMCIVRMAATISQNGLIYDETNIDHLLLRRYAAKKIRLSGGRFNGSAKRTNDQDKAFEYTLMKLLEDKINA
ncbi:MAG: YaiI/YqxD family protein [Clostridiales bacterium]|jgi:uncharacterized protein YaiI (UPF0178 family)|nr:YaiI/YqxD family protein [Clostridiales bacterium]